MNDLIDHCTDEIKDCSINDEELDIVYDDENQLIYGAHQLFHSYYLACKRVPVDDEEPPTRCFSDS